jgi:hypothetical protein
VNAPAAPLHAPRPLSVELARLRDTFAERPATLREIVDVLAGRAWELLMILFVLPFLLPVSVPGMSTPLGLAVAVIAGQLAFGRLPWLPRWLLDRRLPAGFLGKVLGVTQGVVKFLERALRPRLPAMTGARWLHALHLFVVVAAALLLALPLPIPFTNTLPGWTILLFAAGLMERDGLVVAAGYVAMLATLILFLAVGEAVQHSLQLVWQRLAG